MPIPREYVEQLDSNDMPMLGGQPAILYGHGAPNSTNIPDNWISFLQGGYNWNGAPSKIGQIYIDLDADHNNKYVAKPSSNYGLTWNIAS